MPLTELTTKPRYGRYTQAILNVLDLVILNLLMLLTLSLLPDATLRHSRAFWLALNVSYIPVWLWMSSRSQNLRGLHVARVFKHACAALLIHALCFVPLTLFLKMSYTLGFVAAFYGLSLVALTATWVATRMLIRRMRRHGFNTSWVAIIGINPTAERLTMEIQSDPGFGYRLMGYFDDHCPEDFKGTYLGTLDDLDAYLKTQNVHQIFYTYTANANDDLSKAIKISEDNSCEFYYVPRITRFVNRTFTLNTIAAMPILGIRRNPLTKLTNRLLKRGFDVLVSGTFLIFYPLIYLPVALAIKLSSPGPVYFKQDRTGYRGNSFKCYKFRSMKMNANADKVQATEHDPRKTKVGEILRKTSIDELPQFINVLKGDMSIVGPRPHMLKHTEEYSAMIDRYMVRHMVKPGITGWAQVNGYRGLTDELWKMEKRVEYDVWYIENWSLILDLKIMARTVTNAIHGEKNAF